MERKPNEPEKAIRGKMLLFLYSPELGKNVTAYWPLISPEICDIDSQLCVNLVLGKYQIDLTFRVYFYSFFFLISILRI